MVPSTLREPLIDRFGRRHDYLRVSVTDRCNLRCAYCMPEEGVLWKEREEILTFEEIERIVRLFAEMGVSKLRLTGGEPTVRKELPALIARLRKNPGLDHIGLTTNGILFAQEAQVYRDAGLDSVNISLDTLRADRFEAITRRPGLDKVVTSIDQSIAAGLDPVKVNVVALKGFNDDEFADFAGFAYERPVHVRFIEFMPFDGNAWSSGRLVPYTTMYAQVADAFELEPVDLPPSAVAKEFRLVGGLGTVGFITSMTDDFCAGCNRLRITADGQMKNCLFSTGESNLRDLLRGGASDDMLEAAIRENLAGKWKGHPSYERLERFKNRSMILIGG